MPWLGKISTITEAFQFCIPCSLERAPPARHYFINIKGFGLYKCRTCHTTVPGGITLRAGKHATDIKSFHFPKLSAFQRRVPPSPRGGWPRAGEPLTFCPLPTLLDHILRFYSGHLLAGEGKTVAAPQPLLAVTARQCFTLSAGPGCSLPGLAMARRVFISA